MHSVLLLVHFSNINIKNNAKHLNKNSNTWNPYMLLLNSECRKTNNENLSIVIILLGSQQLGISNMKMYMYVN